MLQIGPSSKLLHYVPTGTSLDYAFNFGIKLSYTIELPNYTFEIPPSDILKVGQEMWKALKCLKRATTIKVKSDYEISRQFCRLPINDDSTTNQFSIETEKPQTIDFWSIPSFVHVPR